MGKKSRSKEKNKTKKNKLVAPGHRYFYGVDTADPLPFAKDEEYYAKPLQERPLPDMRIETIEQQYMPKLYDCRSSASTMTAVRIRKATDLLNTWGESVKAHSRVAAMGMGMSLEDLNDNAFFVTQSVLLIQSLSLCGFLPLEAPLYEIEMCLTMGREIDSITQSYPMSSISDMQLSNLLAVGRWIVLLANSIALAMSSDHIGQALNVIQELRAHAENGALRNLEHQQLGITATDSRCALSVIGIRTACTLYQHRHHRPPQQESQGGTTTFTPGKVTSSTFLLDAIEVLTNDLVKFCPESPVGYWYLGYLARESVAKRKWHGLKGAAVCLKHATRCYEAADAQDNDFFKAVGRIQAAYCYILGGDGVVGYDVNDQQVMVRRDFGSDRLPTSEKDLVSTDQKLSFPKETKRIRCRISTTHVGPAEMLMIPRWKVLRLWNEAMVSYDALQKIGMHYRVFGHSQGWAVVLGNLKISRHCEPGDWMTAKESSGFGAKRVKGFRWVEDNFCCVCGKASSDELTPLMKCTRCHEATYCSRDCQKKDWRTHKKVCNKN